MRENALMSNLFGPARRLDDSRSVPEGDTVGSYTSYLDAQKAVDYLADQQFRVQLVSIVGNDVKMIERVTGRLSYPRVALTGALQGIWFGLFVGLLLSFFSPTPSGFGMVPFAMLIGAGFWMLFGIISYAAQRGKRDFTSTSQVVAGSYDVIVAREASAEARRLLQNLPMNHSTAQQQWGAPSRSGSASRAGDTAPPQGNGGSSQGSSDSQPSQVPSRPESWGNPYGAQPQRPAQPQQPAPKTTPNAQSGVGDTAQQQAVQQSPGSSENPEHGTPRRGSYPDLPDGRPQYGVRVSPEEQTNSLQASADQASSDQRTTGQAGEGADREQR